MAFLKPNIVRAVDHCGFPVYNLKGRGVLTIVHALFLVTAQLTCVIGKPNITSDTVSNTHTVF